MRKILIVSEKAKPEKPALHPKIKSALPSWGIPVAIALSWGAVIVKFSLFLALGRVIDQLLLAKQIGYSAIIWLAMMAVLTVVFNAVATVLPQWLGGYAERELRKAILRQIINLGIRDRDTSSGQLLAIATKSVAATAHYRSAFLGPIVGSFTTPFVALLLIGIFLNSRIALWLTLLIALVPLLVGGFQKLVKSIGESYRATQARLTAKFLEAIQALPMLAYASAAQRAADSLAAEGEKYRRSTMKLLAGNQILIFIVDAAFYLTIVVAASCMCIHQVFHGSLSLGHAVSILLATVLIVEPIGVVGMFFYIGIAGRAGQRAISKLLHIETINSSDLAGREVRDGEAGAIVLDRVTAGWLPGKPILNNLSFTVRPGEIVALVGTSGVGKSTISALLQGHIKADCGDIWVDGYNLAKTDPKIIRQRLAVIEQRTFLFLGTVAENLRLAKADATEAELWQALALAGLDRDISQMPLGLDTPVGEHGNLLSGGQAQRLAIARAALRDAAVVIMDEPTSQVDLAGEQLILSALDRLAQGRTILLIAHRPNAIHRADRVITLTVDGVKHNGAEVQYV